MYPVIIANIFAVLLLALGRLQKRYRLSLLCATIFLIVFYSVRTRYANDIPAYMNIFEGLSKCTMEDFKDYNSHVEIGWRLLNLVFAPLGWQCLITFHTIVFIGSMYAFIRRFTAPKYYWLVFGLFVLSPYFLTCLSMLRQTMSMSLCMLALICIANKRFVCALALVSLAVSIHTSACVAYVIFLFPLANRLNNMLLTLCFLGFYITMNQMESYVSEIFNTIMQFNALEHYTLYNAEYEKGSGLGVLLNVIICTWLIFQSTPGSKVRYGVIAMCIAVSLTPFIYLIMQVARIQIYFMWLSIPAYQLFLQRKKKYYLNAVSGCLLFAACFLSVRGFYTTFTDKVYEKSYAVYNTIFDDIVCKSSLFPD